MSAGGGESGDDEDLVTEQGVNEGVQEIAEEDSSGAAPDDGDQEQQERAAAG